MLSAACDGVSEPITVSAPEQAPVESIVAGPTALVLKPSQTKQLIAIAKDSVGNVLTGRTIRWTVDDASVATVSESGLVTAVGTGYVTITATSEGKTFAVAATVVTGELE